MSDLAKNVKEVAQALRQMPEIGLKEFKTAAYLADKLKSFGYAVETNVGGTGVIGVLNGTETGETVALRADMDALSHMVNGEETIIHSCGHNANCAMVLTAAEEIARRGITKGRVKIIFQPAEETLAGALNMIDAGAIDDVDIMLGIHLRHIAEAKYKEATPALCHGASTILEATIEGVPAHGARPHLGVNAIDAACLVIQAINTIHLDPTVPTTAKVTKLQAGGVALNNIPDKAKMGFDLRSQKNTHMEDLIKKVSAAIETAAASIGAKGTIDSMMGVPASEYDQELTLLAREAIVDVLGEKGLLDPITTPGGEDFHYYVKRKPSLRAAYVGLGADLVPGLHHPEMTFNQDALIDGVNILVYMADKLAGLK
ncbi:MAG: amidohydrolase [Sporomusaceae bacterium]|jgi:amidohydrolase|nr:amidohydrolase [Sporomusaceae bacterium]